MEIDKTALKARLLEIARKEAIKFAEDTGQEMKKNIKLEKNTGEKWVKIIYIGEKIQRAPITKEGFEALLTELIPGTDIPNYEIINLPNSVMFKFQEVEILEKVYNHYNNFFFGNMQQQAVESYLTKYINELMDEGCGTGSCGCSGDSCGSHGHSHDTDA